MDRNLVEEITSRLPTSELIKIIKGALECGRRNVPFTESDLLPAMGIAIARFQQFNVIADEAATLHAAIETRKLVDRAKGILMDRHGLREQEAFRKIQQQSMNSRKPMKDIAEAIIIASELERV